MEMNPTKSNKQLQQLPPTSSPSTSLAQQSLNWPNPPTFPSIPEVPMNSNQQIPSPQVTHVSHYSVPVSNPQQLQQPQLHQRTSVPTYPTHVSVLSSVDAAGPLLRSRQSSSSALPLAPFPNLTPPPQVLDQQRRQQARFQSQSSGLPNPPSLQSLQYNSSQRRPLPRAATYTSHPPTSIQQQQQQIQMLYNSQTNLQDNATLLHQSVPGSFNTLQNTAPGYGNNWQHNSISSFPDRTVSHGQVRPQPQSLQQQLVVRPISQAIPVSQVQTSQVAVQQQQVQPRSQIHASPSFGSASGSASATPRPSAPQTPQTPRKQVPVQPIKNEITRPEQAIMVATSNEASEGNAIPVSLTESNDTLTGSTDQRTGPIRPAEINPSDLKAYRDPNHEIGRGTYGTVHVGFFFDSPVAVKRIRMLDVSPGTSSDPAVREEHLKSLRKFVDQIKSRYERVSHSCIVRFYGAFVDEKDLSAILVTDLAVANLGDALVELRKSGGTMHLSAILTIAQQICSGMVALHAAGFSWDDPKPHNILLSKEIDPSGMLPTHAASAMLADFGLSRSISESILDNTSLYKTGQPVASYAYKAPETFIGSELSETAAQAADIYSFGLVLYEMLTMRTPWKRKSFVEVDREVSKGKRPEWPSPGQNDYHGAIDTELRHIVERSWATDPKMRPTAEELRLALQAYTDKNNQAHVQRPVSDITKTLIPGDPRVGLAQSGTLSKQSSTSTAVAIDGSVEFGSTFNGTKESGKSEDDSDSDRNNLLQRKNSTMPVLSNPTGLSPVTSPEPRSLTMGMDIPDTRNVSLQFNDARRSTLLQPALDARKFSHVTRKETSAEEASSSERIQAHQPGSSTGNMEEAEFNNVRQKDGNQVAYQQPDFMNQAGEEYHQSHNFGNNDLHKVPTAEFEDLRNDVSLAFAADAVRLTNGDGQQTQQNLSHRYYENQAFAEHTGRPPLYGGTMDGSLPDLSSSSASSISVRRKRSKRLQSIIEHAAVAFLEIKRREEASGRMPPKQRKEAADKQAAEETRRAMESQALQNIEAAKEREDIATVIDEMRNNRNSYHVARVGATFLKRYCTDEVLFSDICEEGGIEELYAGVSMFTDKDELCKVFCDSITALSHHFDDKANHLIRGIGVPSLVMEVLDSHRTNIKVQIAGCISLASIAATCELSRLAVATLGGPKCIYNAMTKNNSTFKDIELAQAALLAIRCVADKNEDAAKYLIDVSALDTVTLAAETFPNSGIETDILQTFQSFAFYDKGRSTIVTSSGLKCLSTIMLRNQHPEFLVACCKFIRSIARWKDDDCERALLESSIAERVVYVMRQSNEIPGEQGARLAWYAAHSCSFLASFGPNSKTRLCHAEAIETLIGLLRTRKENARVVRAVTDALGDLVNGDPDAKLRAQKCNAIPALHEVHGIHENVSRARNAIRGTLNFLTLPHTVTVADANANMKPSNSASRPPQMPATNEAPPQQSQQRPPQPAATQRRRKFNLWMKR